MEDIIEIYEPIYRESSKLPLIILLILAVTLIVLTALFLIKKIKGKTVMISPEERYNNIITELTDLQSNVDNINSYKFSMDINYLYKEYLTAIKGKNFTSFTSEELFEEIENSNLNLKGLFISHLEPALFGKNEISVDIKKDIIKECVESITFHFNKLGESIA